MKSYTGDGEQVLHNGGSFDSPASSAFGYEITADEAGTYFLSANITTWHINQDLV
eukprot:gene21862-42482_t